MSDYNTPMTDLDRRGRISEITSTANRLEQLVASLTFELEHKSRDAEHLLKEIKLTKSAVEEANEQITQIRSELSELRDTADLQPASWLRHGRNDSQQTSEAAAGSHFAGSSAWREIDSSHSSIVAIAQQLNSSPWRMRLPSSASQELRTRVGIFTVADLSRLPQKTLVRLDGQVQALSVKELGEDDFGEVFREAGLQNYRPDHYSITKKEARRRFNDRLLSLNERNYWGMVVCCHMVAILSKPCMWWLDRMLYRITLTEYMDWRGLEKRSSKVAAPYEGDY